MSRLGFYHIVKNHERLVDQYDLENGDTEIEEPRDLKGYGLGRWFDEGVVGWDPPMETYFIQCIEVGDGLEWWIGTSHREILTFDDLCSVLNQIFANRVSFEFIDSIGKS
jgi:hypothetical protein